MSVNDETVRLNKSFEGYHTKLENGDCTAYQTPLGKSKLTGKMLYDRPTCGYGTTTAVKMGMVWTEDYATQRMMEDLAEAEGYVTRYVTVPINENEKGALTLFTNNCGPENLKKLIARLNKGDRLGTAHAFLLYNKAQGIVLGGLVSRRAREMALFLKPTVAPTQPYMPQTVAKSRAPLSEKAAATVGTVLTVGTQTALNAVAPATSDHPAKTAVSQFMPNLSDIDKGLAVAQKGRSITEQAGDLGQWAWHANYIAPLLLALLLGGIYLIWRNAGSGTTKGASTDVSSPQ